MKHCNKCNGDFPATTEYWTTDKVGALLTTCRKCRSIAASVWYAENKAKVTARKAAYSDARKDELRAVARERYSANPSKAIEATRAWQAAHPEAVKQTSKRWLTENRDLARLRSRSWLKANPQAARRYNEQATNTPEKRHHKSLLSLRWARENPDKANALKAKRTTAKLKRTPKWLTAEHLAEIQVFYTIASKMTKDTGIRHQVDHIVPLRGKLVSGLHVPWNLQVLTIHENASKNNKFQGE